MQRIALALVLLGIAGMLDELDLEFLELWHRFELDNPSTFAAMYQFWVREP